VAPIDLTTTRDGDVTTIAVAGELDLASVGPLRGAVETELDQPGCAAVLLDLSRLSFMDSTGSGAFVALRNRADAVEKRVRLVSVPPQVMRVLTIGGLAYLVDDAEATGQ
jgi:anti-anti-sigma factor